MDESKKSRRERKYRLEVMHDIRRQLQHITQAIAEEDTYWMDIYADQLATTALNFRSDVMREKLEEEASA